MQTPPVILSIAGFDPSGGAGVLADLKAIHACGGYGCAVITAQTVQNTCGVQEVWLEPVAGVMAQIHALRSDLPVTAVKIGMLGTDTMAQAVLNALENFSGPVVMDPVLKSTSGATLMQQGEAFEQLLRRATLVTPNLPEGEQLLGDFRPPDQLAQALAQRFNTAVLLTGGHEAGEQLTDRLALPDGRLHHWTHPAVPTSNTHGTGCVLSSTLATLLAHGLPLESACEQAIEHLQRWLVQSDWRLGQGHGPIRITPQSSPPPP